MRKAPAALEVSENFAMSTVRGKAMMAAFSSWPPLRVVQDLRLAEQQIASCQRGEWPNASFVISDRYEPGDVPR